MTRTTERVLIAVGANVAGTWGEPRQTVEHALIEMPRRGIEVLASAPLIETEPVGGIDQPRFVNGAILAATDLSPSGLLAALKSIEADAGRVATVRWGPRALDLDIVLHGSRVLGWKEGAPDPNAHLVIPHPEMHRRAFVLEPAAAVAPDWRHPVLGLTITEMLEEVRRHS